MITDLTAIWMDTRAYTDLSTVVTAIGANERTIVIAEDTNVVSNLTIPANVTLYFLKGGKITVDATFTVHFKILL